MTGDKNTEAPVTNHLTSLPAGMRGALAGSFIALALSLVIFRFPPWRVVDHDILFMTEPPFYVRFEIVLIRVLFNYWWAFASAGVALAALALSGRLGRRGWPSIVAIAVLSLLWIGYGWRFGSHGYLLLRIG